MKQSKYDDMEQAIRDAIIDVIVKHKAPVKTRTQKNLICCAISRGGCKAMTKVLDPRGFILEVPS